MQIRAPEYQVYFVDACRGIVVSEDAVTATKTLFFDLSKVKDGAQARQAVLFATTAGQLANEQGLHGLFGGALIEGLHGTGPALEADPDKQEFVLTFGGARRVREAPDSADSPTRCAARTRRSRRRSRRRACSACRAHSSSRASRTSRARSSRYLSSRRTPQWSAQPASAVTTSRRRSGSARRRSRRRLTCRSSGSCRRTSTRSRSRHAGSRIGQRRSKSLDQPRCTRTSSRRRKPWPFPEFDIQRRHIESMDTFESIRRARPRSRMVPNSGQARTAS